MPVPPVLDSHLWTKAFWRAYFDLESTEAELSEHEESVTIHMPVGNGYSLDLDFQLPYVYEGRLSLKCPSAPDPIVVASTGYCSFPPLFRLSELDLVSRAIAIHDESPLMTRHLALMLLVRFAPLCIGDPVDVVIEAVHAFLSPLGLDYMEIRYILRTIDHRSDGYRWRFDDLVNGWVLQRYRTYTSGSNLHTQRSTDNKDFPFEIWPQFLSAAEETICNSTNTSSLMALESETTGVLPEYDLPTQHGTFLAVPIGIAPRPLFENAERFLNRALSRILEDLDLGYSAFSGSTRSRQQTTEFRLHIAMYGELERCLLVLRQVLWWQMAPEESLMNDLGFSRVSKLYPLRPITEELKGDKEFHVVFGTMDALGKQPIPQATGDCPCRALFQSALDESDALPLRDGWRILQTNDGGEIRVCVVQSSIAKKDDLVTVNVKTVTAEVARFLFQLLEKGELVMLPALLTAVKGAQDPFRSITSEKEFLKILNDGPYQWWNKNGFIYTQPNL